MVNTNKYIKRKQSYNIIYILKYYLKLSINMTYANGIQIIFEDIIYV